MVLLPLSPMKVVTLGFLQRSPPPWSNLLPPKPHPTSISCHFKFSNGNQAPISRRATVTSVASLFASFLHCGPQSPAIASQELDQQDEDRLVRLFQETSPSVVFIKDLEVANESRKSIDVSLDEEEGNLKVEGTGSGFIWDKFGHIVTNYHVVAKLATDTSGRHRCKVVMVDANGNKVSKEGKLVGCDPEYDIAVLKVDAEDSVFKPVAVGMSDSLRVGQSCFAIGNPYGYENTLTTGVVSGLGREIPSPNGQAIRGAIQTDAAINAGNSGGPLINSYGRVIGVNTSTFTRKGSGMSSGVNFAVPIDSVVKVVPSLIVYGTSYRDRY